MSLAHQIEALITSAAKQLAHEIVAVVRQHVSNAISFDAPKAGVQTGKKKTQKVAASNAGKVEKVSTLSPAQLSARRKTLAKARAVLAKKRKAQAKTAAPVVKAKGSSGHKKGKKTIVKKRQAVSETKSAAPAVKAANGHSKVETTATA